MNQADFDRLDETPQYRWGTGRINFVGTAAEYRSRIRARGQAEHRSREAFPRLQARKARLAILTHMLEREEREQ